LGGLINNKGVLERDMVEINYGHCDPPKETWDLLSKPNLLLLRIINEDKTKEERFTFNKRPCFPWGVKSISHNYFTERDKIL
jgi:hypothetical protein